MIETLFLFVPRKNGIKMAKKVKVADGDFTSSTRPSSLVFGELLMPGKCLVAQEEFSTMAARNLSAMA